MCQAHSISVLVSEKYNHVSRPVVCKEHKDKYDYETQMYNDGNRSVYIIALRWAGFGE